MGTRIVNSDGDAYLVTGEYASFMHGSCDRCGDMADVLFVETQDESESSLALCESCIGKLFALLREGRE